MSQWAYQLEQRGKDFVVIVENVSEQCPRCYAPMQMYDVEFFDDGTIGSTLNLEQLADSRRFVPVEVVCPQGHIVCQARAQIRYLHELSSSRAQESSEVGKVRVIYAKLQKKLLGLDSPSTELLEKSFLPGRLVQADIWVSDEANVSSTATLISPVLIGGKSQIRDYAVCGPFVILIDSIVDKGETISAVSKIDDRLHTFGISLPEATDEQQIDIESLVSSLGSVDDRKALEISRTLRSIVDTRTVHVLISALKSKNILLSTRAAVELKELAQVKGDLFVDPLLAALHDRVAFVRWVSAEALGHAKSKKAIEGLISALRDENVNVRQNAAWSLGEIGDPKAIIYLEALLNDSGGFIRDSATDAINKLKSSTA